MPKARLLLFGPPGAGKSSLLGALAYGAPTLQAEVANPSTPFKEFVKNTYKDQLTPTEETNEYQLTVASTNKNEPWPAIELTVVDCGGDAAMQMLKADAPFQKGQPLRLPVLDADVVVIVVDASLPLEARQPQFDLFARWLLQLVETRGERIDTAELPVYLVLNKCDLFARKDETFAIWQKRLEKGKRQIGEKFQEYLKDQGIGFGTVKVHLWATAIRTPAFIDREAKAKEPYGVAELFRACAESAAEYQDRGRRARNRLQNFLFALVGLVAILAMIVFLLVEFQPETKATPLDEEAQLALPREGATSAQRLQGTPKRLGEKLKQLTEVETHADFEKLPRETREAVSAYRKDLDEYLTRYDAAQKLKLPHLAKNQKELDENEKAVRSFTFTEAQARDWAGTRLTRDVERVRKEYDVFKKALDEEEVWIRKQIEETDRRWSESNRLLENLRKKQKDAVMEAREWLRQERKIEEPDWPASGGDTVPGLTRITYDDLRKFDAPQRAIREWETTRSLLANNRTGIAKLIK